MATEELKPRKAITLLWAVRENAEPCRAAERRATQFQWLEGVPLSLISVLLNAYIYHMTFGNIVSVRPVLQCGCEIQESQPNIITYIFFQFTEINNCSGFPQGCQ